MEGTASTIVFIKNTTGAEQKFTGEFTHSGGAYNLGLRKLAAGETLALDLRALRDNQTPDASGKTIAADATSGHVRWSVHGPANLTLIGRAEQVDTARGMTSSFSCQTCCPERFYDGWLSPDPINCIVGDTFFLEARQRNIDCYQVVGQPFSASPFYWSSSNISVMSVDNFGYAEAEGEGTAWVGATWDIVTRWYDLGGICQSETGSNNSQQPAQVVAAAVNISSVVSNHTEVHTNENATITANISAEPGAAGQTITVNFYEASRTGTITSYGLTPGSVTYSLTSGNNQVAATLTNNSAGNNGTVRINVSISGFDPAKIRVTGNNPTASESRTLKPAN